MLTPEEIRRYSRHLLLPHVGKEGQLKLKDARLLLVGVGGLGAPVGLYLAAAGVGTLGIVDFDTVDVTNLQRQVTFGTEDVGRPKIEAARDRLGELNPSINIIVHDVRLSRSNALEILEAYDIVVDGSDNFATRYLVNDACVLLGKPNVYGSVFRFDGQATVFHSDGPCYRCLFAHPPAPGAVPSCEEGGVLGVVPGIIGSIQANEVIKLIVGIGDTLIGRLLLFDALKMIFREIALHKNRDCPICGQHPSITELVDYDEFCGEVRSAHSDVPEITVAELKAMNDRAEPPFLIDVREPHEREICHLDGILIPLRELPAHMERLDRSRDTVVYCRSGVRSASAVDLLRRSGFRNVWNLRGGILAWSDEVDPSVPKY